MPSVFPKLLANLLKLYVSTQKHNNKSQTKSFEDMNILIKTILKFCTTNQLFKYFFSEKHL